jgi:hypothetical protein
MRLIHVILTALFAVFALVAGLFAAAVVAIAGTILYALKRIGRGPLIAGTRPGMARPRARPAGDVIEVTATEVATETAPERIAPPRG